MHPYLDALNAMHELLGALGEQHWRSWIAQDIDEWESHKSIRHHLAAYGGMGSFNDIAFEDVWLGTLFDYLKSSCYYFAHHPTGKLDMRALGSLGFELSGWRCLACGYGVVSRRDIDYFIAHRVIRQRILTEAERTRLREFVRSVIHAHPSDPVFTNERVAAWADRSGVHVRESNDWLRPCPACGTDDTAVYRWSLVEGDGYRFVPSHENLPLRTGGADNPLAHTAHMEKSRITPAKHEEMIREYPIADRVPGWYFRMREKTPSVWDVEGRDIYGREVSRLSVVDEEHALQECIEYARKISGVE